MGWEAWWRRDLPASIDRCAALGQSRIEARPMNIRARPPVERDPLDAFLARELIPHGERNGRRSRQEGPRRRRAEAGRGELSGPALDETRQLPAIPRADAGARPRTREREQMDERTDETLEEADRRRRGKKGVCFPVRLHLGLWRRL